MSNHNSTDSQRIPISAAHERMFHAEAPAALRRRSREYLIAQVIQMSQYMVIGGIGLAGIYLWNWSATALLIVFLAGIFVGMFFDFLRIVLQYKQVKHEIDRFYGDQFVWSMVLAKMMKRDTLPAQSTQSAHLGVLVMVDLLGGCAAAAFCYFGVQKIGLNWQAEIMRSTSLQIALAGIVALPVLNALMRFTRQARHEEEVPEIVKTGGRGLGLLILTFGAGAFADSPDVIRAVMIFINAATIVLGLLAMFGLVIMYKERQWLAEYLRQPKSSR